MEAFRLTKANLMDGWKSEEASRILDYYEKHKHDGNRVRDPIDIINSLKVGAFYVIEDDQANPAGASASFGTFNKYVEAGGTRVTKEGFGFQKVFHWVRLIDFALFQTEDSVYFSVVADWNKQSISNIENSGFEQWKPTKPELALIGKLTEDSEAVGGILFYKQDGGVTPKVERAALNLLYLHENPVIKSRHVDETISLTLDVPLVNNNGLRSALQKLADSATARGERPMKLGR